MKNFILFSAALSMFIFSNLGFAQAQFSAGGDGTLPILRTLKVTFQDAGHFKLPKCVLIHFTKGQNVKTVNFKEAKIAQNYIQVKKSNTVDVFVKTMGGEVLSEDIVSSSMKSALNEIKLASGTLIQTITPVNMSTSSACVSK